MDTAAVFWIEGKFHPLDSFPASDVKPRSLAGICPICLTLWFKLTFPEIVSFHIVSIRCALHGSGILSHCYHLPPANLWLPAAHLRTETIRLIDEFLAYLTKHGKD